MEPTHDKETVKRLAAGSDTFEMSKNASDDAVGFGLDEETVREILQRVEEFEFLKTAITRKGNAGSFSDYYSYYVEECLS